MLKVGDTHSEITLNQNKEYLLTDDSHDAQKICLLFLLILDEIQRRYEENSQKDALKNLAKTIRPAVEKQQKIPLESLIKSSQKISKKEIVKKHRKNVESALIEMAHQVQSAFSQMKEDDQQALCRNRVQWKLIGKIFPRQDPNYARLKAVFEELTEETSQKFRSDFFGKILWAIQDASDQEWHDRK